jgi:hypothetical protein
MGKTALGAMLLAFVVSACASNSSADAVAEASSPEASPCPANVPCDCSCPTAEDGGQCVCASFSMPACPASLQSDMGQSCVSGESCMNCIGGVAGIECSCSDFGPGAADGGLHWLCIGTGEQCTGGTWHG